jgi:hypothetical protein
MAEDELEACGAGRLERGGGGLCGYGGDVSGRANVCGDLLAAWISYNSLLAAWISYN